jgi:hypothetical protein
MPVLAGGANLNAFRNGTGLGVVVRLVNANILEGQEAGYSNETRVNGYIPRTMALYT